MLNPGAETKLEFVNQLSKKLTDAQSQSIPTDIDAGLFELVEIPKDLLGLKPRAPKKQKRQDALTKEGGVEEEEADEEEDEDGEVEGAE